ncbi:MAG: hypothetical protein QM811_07515 [Pirellulales bacterium]
MNVKFEDDAAAYTYLVGCLAEAEGRGEAMLHDRTTGRRRGSSSGRAASPPPRAHWPEQPTKYYVGGGVILELDVQGRRGRGDGPHP